MLSHWHRFLHDHILAVTWLQGLCNWQTYSILLLPTLECCYQFTWIRNQAFVVGFLCCLCTMFYSSNFTATGLRRFWSERDLFWR